MVMLGMAGFIWGATVFGAWRAKRQLIRDLPDALIETARQEGWQRQTRGASVRVRGKDFWLQASAQQTTLRMSMQHGLPDALVQRSKELLGPLLGSFVGRVNGSTKGWLDLSVVLDPTAEAVVYAQQKLRRNLRQLDGGATDPLAATGHFTMTVENVALYAAGLETAVSLNAPDLPRLLQRGYDQENRVWHLATARHDASPRGFQVLRDLVVRSFALGHRVEALTALLERPEMASLPPSDKHTLADPLLVLVKHARGQLLSLLLEALTDRLGRIPPLPLLSRRLHEVGLNGREAIVNVLERFYLDDIEPVLLPLLNHEEDPDLRLRVIQLLRQVGTPLSLGPLERLRETSQNAPEAFETTRALNAIRLRHADALNGAGGLTVVEDQGGELSHARYEAGELSEV